jgi:molybdenum cofactor biosynthesis enzyme
LSKLGRKSNAVIEISRNHSTRADVTANARRRIQVVRVKNIKRIYSFKGNAFLESARSAFE